MFEYFLKRRQEKRKAHELYCDLVAHARSEAFYTQYGVEDSVEGRFDMILLFLFLVDNRLGQEGDIFSGLRRTLQEAMVSDMDRSFRELGVGDMSVGKEMKKVGAAWLGRRSVYGAAMATGADKSLLPTALIKNIYNGDKTEVVEKMTAYVRRTHKLLELMSLSSLEDCKFVFPAPSDKLMPIADK